jgi:chromosome segregation ATPase
LRFSNKYVKEGFENLTVLVTDREAISNNLNKKEKELLSLQREYDSDKADFEERLSTERHIREELEQRLEELESARNELSVESQARINDVNVNVTDLVTERDRLQKKLDQSRKSYKSLEVQWNGAMTKLKEFKSWRAQDASQAEELEGEIKRLSSKLRTKDDDWNALLAVLNSALNESSISNMDDEKSLSERLQKLLAAKDKALEVYEKEFEELGMGVTKIVKLFVDKSKNILQDDFSPSVETQLEQTVFKHKTNINRISSMEKVFGKILDLIHEKLKKAALSEYDPEEFASSSQDEIRMLKRRIVSLKHQVKEAYELESLEASDKEKVMIARYFEMETRYEEERERHKEDYDAFQARVKQCDLEIQRLRQALSRN